MLGFGVKSANTGETGPKLTWKLVSSCQYRGFAVRTIATYFLKGPDVTHPPPFPGGRLIWQRSFEGMHVLLRPGWGAPSPDTLVSLPSRSGDLDGSADHFGQL